MTEAKPRVAADTSGVEVRRATAADLPAVAELLAALGYPASPDELRDRLRALTGEDHALLVAVEADGGVLGLVGLHSFPVLHAPWPVGYITALVTRAEARGRGVGRAMVKAAENWARARGCGRLTVTSAEPRADAHAFYPACGLPYTGRRFSKSLA